MKTALMTFATALALGVSAEASLLKLDPGTKTTQGVRISKGGTAEIDGRTYDLTTVGSGVRSKKVLISKVKVYVAQLLVSNPNAFIRKDSDALKSLADSQTVAMHLSFLRTVDADKVQVSFRDALIANHVKIMDPEIRQFLAAVAGGGDASANRALTIVINKNSDGSETLVYEDTHGRESKITGPRGFTRDIFSIWLGASADEGVADLKRSLLSQD
ncbi:chalcone isomerase family protein [Bdellovibrio sp. HCB337]|uniref:chalcone isomerase family protein n=1 Tax=Bdellovibrio sp. HCB337 TaxID=3394358 RepID=UPI0039A4BFE3